jgi:VanZ family protein
MFRIQNGERWFFPLIYVLWFFSIAGVVMGSLKPGVELPVSFWNADKLVHLFAYLWLALLPALIVKSKKRLLLLLWGLILLGCLLEFGQMYVPGRMFSLADMGANTAGVFLGFSMGKRFRFQFWRALSVKRYITG